MLFLNYMTLFISICDSLGSILEKVCICLNDLWETHVVYSISFGVYLL